MYGIKNLKTDKHIAVFMHIPKTSGTHFLESINPEEFEVYPLNKYIPCRQNRFSITFREQSHATLEQVYMLYPTLGKFIDNNNLDVFTFVRDPFERFVSCCRFLPVFMTLDTINKGQSNYGESTTHEEFISHYATLLSRPQSDWIDIEGRPQTRMIHLSDIQNKEVEIVDGMTIDYRKSWWSNEDAVSKVRKETPTWNIPKFTLDAETKRYVEWLWKKDFALNLQNNLTEESL